MKKNLAKIDYDDLSELVHWARRYCDFRSTYAPHTFNQTLDRIRKLNPAFIDPMDDTLMNHGTYFPYAQDGMYNPKTGAFDARPLHAQEAQNAKDKG